MNADRVWGTFTVTGIVAFAVAETVALRERDGEKPSGTLTAWIRRHTGIALRKPRRFLTIPAFLAFLIWFTGHIVLGWKP